MVEIVRSSHDNRISFVPRVCENVDKFEQTLDEKSPSANNENHGKITM